MPELLKIEPLPKILYRDFTISAPEELFYFKIDVRRHRQYQAQIALAFKVELIGNTSVPSNLIQVIKENVHSQLSQIFSGSCRAKVETIQNSFSFQFVLPANRPLDISTKYGAICLICRIFERTTAIVGSNEKIINHLTYLLKRGIDDAQDKLEAQHREDEILNFQKKKKEDAQNLIDFLETEIEIRAKRNINFDFRIQALQSSLKEEKQKELLKVVQKLKSSRTVIKSPQNSERLLPPESVDLAIESLIHDEALFDSR